MRCSLSQDYSTEGLTESQLGLLQEFREFGLVYQRKVYTTECDWPRPHFLLAVAQVPFSVRLGLRLVAEVLALISKIEVILHVCNSEECIHRLGRVEK